MGGYTVRQGFFESAQLNSIQKPAYSDDYGDSESYNDRATMDVGSTYLFSDSMRIAKGADLYAGILPEYNMTNQLDARDTKVRAGLPSYSTGLVWEHCTLRLAFASFLKMLLEARVCFSAHPSRM